MDMTINTQNMGKWKRNNQFNIKDNNHLLLNKRQFKIDLHQVELINKKYN